MQVVKEVGNSSFFKDEFVRLNSRDCKLLLEFSEEHFSYSILQISTNEVLYTAVSNVVLNWFQATESQLTDIFNKEEVFNFKFGEVVILTDTIYSTLVPTVFFDQNKINTYLNTNMYLSKVALKYLSFELADLEYQYLYILPETLYSFLEKNFLSISFRATESELLNFLNRKNVAIQYVNVHITYTKLHFCYFEDKKLKFSNTFSYQSNEDLLYNILNIYKQLGLNTEKVILNLSGIIIKQSEIYELLYKYIKFINFQKRPLKLNYSKSLKEMPEHYFMHHYAALL